MTILGAILKKVKSLESNKDYPSPPPELEKHIHPKKKSRHKFLYAHIGAKVDTSPPVYSCRIARNLPTWTNMYRDIYSENIALVTAIKRMHFSRGVVDCRWDLMPPPVKVYHESRKNCYRRINIENQAIYKRILHSGPRVQTAASHRRDWAHNRANILNNASKKFVLFPPVPHETFEDSAFAPPPDCVRTRVLFTVKIKDAVEIGELQAELFTDVCPATCRLFLELLDGDEAGFGYVGTHFFRKVPNMFWSGGDVTRDNGFGCYLQKGRRLPLGAENYHFSHSMPGLLTMRVSPDDEMCGIFSITFKPLPQFDLKNVVFGRIIRPSAVFNIISEIGSPLVDRPTVLLSAARRRVPGGWLHGRPNTRLTRTAPRIVPSHVD